MKFGDLGLGGLRIRMRGSRSKYHIIAAVKSNQYLYQGRMHTENPMLEKACMETVRSYCCSSRTWPFLAITSRKKGSSTMEAHFLRALEWGAPGVHWTEHPHDGKLRSPNL